ncbi:MAG: SPOR domain-containing protein [Candidatus Zixiibacteriota bacterium]|nr:MAG: SPOR domain-containing protein [candidate division Zixibacteria bacterium]
MSLWWRTGPRRIKSRNCWRKSPMMKKTVSICSLCLLLLLSISGCQQAAVGVEERPTAKDTTAVDTRGFDPLDLPGDRVVVSAERPRHLDLISPQQAHDTSVANTVTDSLPVAVVPEPMAIDSNAHQAFRVQLLTTKLFGKAKQAVKVAEEIFDQPVFVDYEVPYFKVRVGSFGDRDHAERYLQKARTAGYANAWVVVVNLDIKEPELLYDHLPPTVPDSDTLSDTSMVAPDGE